MFLSHGYRGYKALLNCFYPLRCLACGEDLDYLSATHLCIPCQDKVRAVLEPTCVICCIHLPGGGEHCFNCKRQKPKVDLIRSACVYDGALRELVHHFKYQRKDYLKEELSEYLVETWEKFEPLQEVHVVIPVPMHRRSLKERGYNQAELLARSFLKKIERQSENKDRITCVLQSLHRRLPTVSQTRLSREERRMNVEQAFVVADAAPIFGKNILLMDDVCTTGATLNACAKVLKEAGAKKVFGLTLARD